MDPLLATLSKLRLVLGLRTWLEFVAKSFIYTTSFGFAWVVATRLFPLLGDAMAVSGVIILLGAVAASIAAFVARPTLLHAALAADKQLGLKERLTSSLELEGTPGDMVEAIHADARNHIKGLEVSQHFPIVANQSLRWVYLPLSAYCIAYLLLPQFDLFGLKKIDDEEKARVAAVAVQVQRLKEATKPLEELTEAAGLAAGEILSQVAELANDLQRGTITEKQAIARISNLSETLAEHRNQLAEQNAKPKLAGDVKKFGPTQNLAKALQSGRMKDALAMARELQESLKNDNLTEQERKEIAEELKDIANMMGGEDSEMGEALSKALAKASAGISAGDVESSSDGFELLALALEDLEGVLEQIEMLDLAMANISEWQSGMGEYDGEWDHLFEDNGWAEGAGRGWGQGSGMGGPGMGAGNEVGELPEGQVGFQPTKTGGPMVKGRMLADIMQKALPEGDAEPTLEFISGSFMTIKQEAEQALTHQEIPQASKEFVRQYFSSLDPEGPDASP